MYDEVEETTPHYRAAVSSVRQYLEDIGKTPLLTAQEERDLAADIAAGVAAAERLARGDLDADEQQIKQDQRLVRKGQDAKERFYLANLRLVVSIARRYRPPTGVELLDLVQEGNLGLEHAITKFDAEKGFRFSTYGTWWIRQHISKYIELTRSSLQVPGHASADAQHLLKGRGNGMSDAEIAELRGWDEKKLARIQQAAVASATTSLDKTVGQEGGSTTLGDLIDDNRNEERIREVDADISFGSLIGILKEILTERELAILLARTEYESDSSMQLKDLAKKHQLSLERIRQITKIAQAKLKHPSVHHLMDQFKQVPISD